MLMINRIRSRTLDPIEIKKRLGLRLKQLRKNAGYTSAEKFANDNNFSRPTYGKYEQGKPDMNIELDTLIRLIGSHGINMKEFFSEGFD